MNSTRFAVNPDGERAARALGGREQRPVPLPVKSARTEAAHHSAELTCLWRCRCACRVVGEHPELSYQSQPRYLSAPGLALLAVRGSVEFSCLGYTILICLTLLCQRRWTKGYEQERGAASNLCGAEFRSAWALVVG